MLHEFLDSNRAKLINRCREKVARRPPGRGTSDAVAHGIPLFLEQVIETLRVEHLPPAARDTRRHVPSELARSAALHGHELLRGGYAIDQVVYDYGDLCQAITELAIEEDTPVSAREFHTLNRCLDDAIADAVTEFGWQRDQLIAQMSTRALNERLGFLAHELRNSLNTAILSFAVIKTGKVDMDGPTSAVLDRSLVGLRDLIDRALADVRLSAGKPPPGRPFRVDQFIAEVKVAASLEAASRKCPFTVVTVAPDLVVSADKPMLYSAVSNLLQNAFKFTRPGGHVSLRAHGTDDRVLIEVQDQCGGLKAGAADAMFVAFHQHHADRSGLGLGLSIAKEAVVASGGEIRVTDLPGVGCVFTIDLPRALVPVPALASYVSP
ncbi:MAG: HAMP domain-containing sensor histidine kinase [Usitatibacter sp.]